jgi:hypothetical protein
VGLDGVALEKGVAVGVEDLAVESRAIHFVVWDVCREELELNFLEPRVIN